MSLLNRLLHEAAPAHVFEFSEAGVAYSASGVEGFAEFAPGTLVASPVQDNILSADAVASAARTLIGR